MNDVAEGSSSSSEGAPPARVRRWTEWLVIGVAVAAAWPIWSFRGELSRPGSVVEASITLVTSDRSDLSCAADRAFGGFRCEFQTPDQSWAKPPARTDVLAPYMSESRQMFLIPRLFEQSAISARYEREPPERTRRDLLRRFRARCQLLLVERVEEGFDVRWVRGTAWGRSDAAWVAVPISCQVDG